jgi:hypothetical protein
MSSPMSNLRASFDDLSTLVTRFLEKNAPEIVE